MLLRNLCLSLIVSAVPFATVEPLNVGIKEL